MVTSRNKETQALVGKWCLSAHSTYGAQGSTGREVRRWEQAQKQRRTRDGGSVARAQALELNKLGCHLGTLHQSLIYLQQWAHLETLGQGLFHRIDEGLCENALVVESLNIRITKSMVDNYINVFGFSLHSHVFKKNDGMSSPLFQSRSWKHSVKARCCFCLTDHAVSGRVLAHYRHQTSVKAIVFFWPLQSIIQCPKCTKCGQKLPVLDFVLFLMIHSELHFLNSNKVAFSRYLIDESPILVHYKQMFHFYKTLST